MQSTLTGLALVLALGASIAAGYALSQDRGDPVALAARLEALDTRLARIEQALEADASAGSSTPSLVGRARAADPTDPAAPAGAPGTRVHDAAVRDLAEQAPPVAGGAEATEQIQALVDEAVDKKAAQVLQMQDKKPSIGAFAKTLELTDEQRRLVEQEVLRGQREIQTILQTPTADGTVFMDELVDVMADSIAHPGEKSGRWMKLFGRLMSEEYPGTSESYALRAEAVKTTVREGFRRELSERQYASFEAWQMDPTEIKDVPDSPWKDVEARVLERARALGAEIPPRGE